MTHVGKIKHLWQLCNLSTILTTHGVGGSWWGKFWTYPRKRRLKLGRENHLSKGTINPYEGWLIPRGRPVPEGRSALTRDDLLEGCRVKRSLVWTNPPLGFPHSCVRPIHTSLHRNYLHTMTKGLIAQSDLL